MKGAAVLPALCISMTAIAQGLINQSNLYIPAGLEVHVEGAVTNSGFIQNQGELFVTGDWSNTSVYQGLGRLTFNGAALQRFHNNTNSVHRLRVDATGPIVLEDKIAIDNRLELDRGVVSVSSPHSLTLGSSATVTGGSVQSFVDGPLIATGTGYKFMPIGRNGGYYPVELLDVTGIGPVVELEAYDNMGAFRLEGYHRIVSNVYWRQSVLQGTYSGSPVTIGYDLASDTQAREEWDIFQSTHPTGLFSGIGNTSVSFETPLDKITSASRVTGTLFLIGKRVNVDTGIGNFYFPTSLSPDAVDPNNRSVRVFGGQLDADGFLFVVYNRWGLKVFESRSLAEMSSAGWSGQQEAGGTLASGVYPYLLRGIRKSGEVLEQKGMISIIR